jgi:hypothetical protein
LRRTSILDVIKIAFMIWRGVSVMSGKPPYLSSMIHKWEWVSSTGVQELKGRAANRQTDVFVVRSFADGI